MSTNPTPASIKKVERDSNLFVWFLTLVVGGLAIWSMFQKPELQAPLTAVIYLTLVLAHILLHWILGTIESQSKKLFWYIVFQGVLAFIISWMSGQIGMAFALFMGLLGEAIGLFGLTRRALLASVYYLILAAVNISQTTEVVSLGWTLLGIIPMVIFVVVYVTLYMRQHEAR